MSCFFSYFTGTVYKIDVYSTSFGILSFQPRSIEIKTPPYPPVGPVYVSNITFSTLTIEWQWPVGNVDYFEVRSPLTRPNKVKTADLRVLSILVLINWFYTILIISRQCGRVARSVAFTTVMIAGLIVQLPS